LHSLPGDHFAVLRHAASVHATIASRLTGAVPATLR
jgi:hypothetical protein